MLFEFLIIIRGWRRQLLDQVYDLEGSTSVHGPHCWAVSLFRALTVGSLNPDFITGGRIFKCFCSMNKKDNKNNP